MNVAIDVVAPDAGVAVLRTEMRLTRHQATRQVLTKVLLSRIAPTHRVSAGIHAQAARLWVKRVPFVAHPRKRRLVRPRLILYAASIVIVGAVVLFGLSTRATIDLNVLRDRNPTFVRLSDGSIRNAYTLKVINHGNAARNFVLSIEGSPRSKQRSSASKREGGPHRHRHLR